MVGQGYVLGHSVNIRMYIVKKTRTVQGVVLHYLKFFRRKTRRLFKDRVRNSYLPHIMEHGAYLEDVTKNFTLRNGNIVVMRPFVVDLNRVTGHTVYMGSGFLWVP